VKIGRLAVSTECANSGFGKLIIRIVKEMYAHLKQQAGCRFITVDAYQNALEFYKKNGFDFLTEKDAQEQTRAMYLDLKAFVWDLWADYGINAIDAAIAVFGEENVRAYTGGIPKVWLSESAVDKDKVKELLYPKKIFPNGVAQSRR